MCVIHHRASNSMYSALSEHSRGEFLSTVACPHIYSNSANY